MGDDHFRSAYVPHDIAAPLVGASRGPLAGLTVAVKDMFDIAGERAGGGSPAWLAAQAPARAHSAVVERVLQAGGTIIGKTVCDEFFYSVTGTNFHYDAPLNPRAMGRIPGGSSSGSASAASAGSCDIAIGSDTGGSVRVPAALCGVYGIRTTHGRMDLRGAMSMAPSFDAGGWFAASAGVFRRAGQALLPDFQHAGGEGASLRIATDAFAVADARIAVVLRDFIRKVGPHLPATSEVVVAGDDIDRWREAFRLTQGREVWETFGDFITRQDPKLGPGVVDRMRIAAAITDAEVQASRPVLDHVRRRMEDLTSDRTILALPTAPTIAPLTTSTAQDLESYRVRTMRLVCPASISGLPQLTLPVGTVDGAPVGLSLLGWRNGEEALLDLAVRLSPFVGIAG